MKHLDLKAKVLSLANVQNSQDLKRYYPIAKSFNLSHKKSWEELLLEFQAMDKPERKNKPKISELKAKVLKLANVQTVNQLKRHCTALKGLNFRYYSTWETALSELEGTNLEDPEFKNWLESPPQEYKELFREIQDVSQSLEQSIERGKKLGDDATEMVDNMMILAEDTQAEVNEMKQEIIDKRKIRQQAELN